MRVFRPRLLVLAMATCSVVLAAQPSPPQPTFRTEANYVRVDAYPTRDGVPIADLTQADFEIVENGIAQKIEQFEHVVIQSAGPQAARIEPETVRESRAMLENPRARVFVLFLDVGHVEIAGSHNIRAPLIDTLDKVIGRDDLVGVMTPEMSASDVTFARKTTTIDGLLTKHWPWGERDHLNLVDPAEQRFEACYGPQNSSGLTRSLIARFREKTTLDALENLVEFLRGVREERKAILAITDGWVLYRPSDALANVFPPAPPPVGVAPGTGRLTIGARDSGGTPMADCERDRQLLAQIDDDEQFRRLLDEANRANASFYPVDPRGLAVFDSPIQTPMSLEADAQALRARETSLRTLAEATDGTAVVATNRVAQGMQRIVSDLSSYYLLGYYSTGKVDGRFHAISVKVKRPGVLVRARRGYLAASPRNATTSASNRTGPSTASPVVADAVAAAVMPLSSAMREQPLRLHVAAGWKPDGGAAIATVAEFSGDEWKSGAEADLMLTRGGDTVATAHASLPIGTRAIRVALPIRSALQPGDYTLMVRARAAAGSPTTQSLQFAVTAAPASTGAMFIRRGQSTGNRDVPTADVRFRRNEQIRIEVPSASSDAASGRLLDRTGKELPVPVAVATRDDADGSRWRSAQLSLAPLAPGDYVIEVAEGERRTLAAFRVIP